jgi:hypothetical protein
MDGTRHEVARGIAISILLFASSFAVFFAVLGADPSDKFLAWTYSFPCGQPTESACARMQVEADALRAAKQPCSYVLIHGLQQCQTLLADNVSQVPPRIPR